MMNSSPLEMKPESPVLSHGPSGVPADGGGRRPEPELDRLSNILKTFHDQFGGVDRLIIIFRNHEGDRVADHAHAIVHQSRIPRAITGHAIAARQPARHRQIAEAGRLEPFTPPYDSVVVNKGAMVFHMLRA